MQIQVFMGSAGDGKTSKLQSVQDRLEFTGESAPIIQARLMGRMACWRFWKCAQPVANAKSLWTTAAGNRS